MTNPISLSLLTPKPLISEADGRKFLDLLICAGQDFIPQLVGSSYPADEPFDPARPDNALRFWRSHFLWQRDRPDGRGTVLMAAADAPFGAIHMEAAPPADAAAIQRLLLALCEAFDADIGFVHLLTERDVNFWNNYRAVEGSDAVIEMRVAPLAPLLLRKGIPELYWLTLFGPPYVKLLGRERLLSAPAFETHELKTGAVALQLSEAPLDLESRFAAVDEVRRRVKAHLDCNAFFDPQLPSGRVYAVPPLRRAPPAELPPPQPDDPPMFQKGSVFATALKPITDLLAARTRRAAAAAAGSPQPPEPARKADEREQAVWQNIRGTLWLEAWLDYPDEIIPIPAPVQLDPAMRDRLEEIDWFAQCGRPLQLRISMPVRQVMEPEALRTSLAPGWVDANMRASEDVEAAVRAFSQRIWAAVWSPLTSAALPYVREQLLPAMRQARERRGLSFPSEPAGTVHLLNAIREDVFNEVALPHRLFTELLDVYEAGHMPCGWEGGRWPEGTLLVW